MRHLYVATLCLIAAFAPCVGAQEIGPAHGALVIVGGGRLDSTITIRFLELAGGRDAPIVVIPTANGDGDYGPYWAGLSGFKAVGATNLTVLHTTSRAARSVPSPMRLAPRCRVRSHSMPPHFRSASIHRP